MRKIRWILQLNVLLLLSSSFQNKKEETYPLTVKVKDLRNEMVLCNLLFTTPMVQSRMKIIRNITGKALQK
jgi:hypothetical protein